MGSPGEGSVPRHLGKGQEESGKANALSHMGSNARVGAPGEI